MTEPEDVEEDLFADLYDADETTQPAAPPASAPAPTPVPAVISSTPHPGTANLSQTQLAQTQPQAPFQAQTTENYEPGSTDAANYEQPGGQNGISQFDVAAQVDSTSLMNTQPETQGTGIKEDG
ncbi:predicted protein [Uncinocarpus reesii 1704]|uniref:Uncharacterized protein n=1 Tax=Uncinocarpus reesii (strain UAMH 1704) TaxID=336963 RepID=C4JF36_UNCRE|nr:uncharacterized protein UREG_00937 [Uncinocarpus reesii 1704]EEP76089.1 predicted protein [Uncinocarpus reesii 1704]